MKKLLKLSMLSTGVTLGIMASSGAIAQGACSVDYATANSWGNGAQLLPLLPILAQQKLAGNCAGPTQAMTLLPTSGTVLIPKPVKMSV